MNVLKYNKKLNLSEAMDLIKQNEEVKDKQINNIEKKNFAEEDTILLDSPINNNKEESVTKSTPSIDDIEIGLREEVIGEGDTPPGIPVDSESKKLYLKKSWIKVR